jgi:hypothetical protein
MPNLTGVERKNQSPYCMYRDTEEGAMVRGLRVEVKSSAGIYICYVHIVSCTREQEKIAQ